MLFRLTRPASFPYIRLVRVQAVLIACGLIFSFTLHDVSLEHTHVHAHTHTEHSTDAAVGTEYFHAMDRKILLVIVVSIFVLFTGFLYGQRHTSLTLLKEKHRYRIITPLRERYFCRYFDYHQYMFKRGILHKKMCG